MTTIRFPRPTPALLSMNKRAHWSAIRTWRRAAAVAAGGRTPIRIMPETYKPPSMVVVTLDVPDKRRRDPANFFASVKPIVDGLVDAGWWPDDTPEWVTVVEPVLRVVPRGEPLMVQVELRPR